MVERVEMRFLHLRSYNPDRRLLSLRSAQISCRAEKIVTAGPVEWVENHLSEAEGRTGPELFKNWDRFSSDTQERIEELIAGEVEEIT